jgi:hypothetical protein
MNRTAINKLLKGIGGEENVWISDHKVWTEIMKKKHIFVKENQYVSWLSEFQ